MVLLLRKGTKNYYYDITVAGRRLRGSTGTPVRAEAERIEAQVRAGAIGLTSRAGLIETTEIKKVFRALDDGIKGKPFNLNPLFKRCKENAARRKIEFHLSIEDLTYLWNRARGGCEITGMPFDTAPPNGKGWRAWAPSIDRIDCKKGYTRANCRLVAVAVNQALGTWGEQTLLMMARAIARRQGWL